MDTAVIEECSRMSFADTPFPEIVKRLAGAGVAAYRTDLIAREKRYYDASNDAHDAALPLHDAPVVAGAFDEAEVSRAVRSIQRRELGYAEFLRRIMAAGCASYAVFIEGRKTIYFGRDGGFHVENFPSTA